MSLGLILVRAAEGSVKENGWWGSKERNGHWMLVYAARESGDCFLFLLPDIAVVVLGGTEQDESEVEVRSEVSSLADGHCDALDTGKSQNA